MFRIRGFHTTQQLYESEKSIIYRAARDADGVPVVLKVLKAVQPPPETIARFKREYLLTRELDMPGVIRAYDHVQTENHWVIVTEDFGGESLARLGLAGELDIRDALGLAIDITEILARIHERTVIHKDINPSNVVINQDTGVVKIIDFGIAVSRLSEETVSFEHPTLLEGTPGYLSPEQTGRINRALDYRTDFYSLGCTLYHLITGILPFTTSDLLELVHAHLARDPRPPSEVRGGVSDVLSAVILKLMAKNPDERYQSAHGLKVDLEACLDELDRPRREPFVPGRGDITTRFRLPAKLYGRAREIDALMRAFDRVGTGLTGLMLVNGYSGIGKSALVRELYEPITAKKGFFVAGKFEQYERNIPYAPIVQAFQALIQQLLCESEARIVDWRDKLVRALGSSCGVLMDVIPHLELITGALPAPAPLPPGESQVRLMRAISEFVGVFARAEHPLVLFLDDLQWSDNASLEFIKNLTASSPAPYLFIIGAYRDNEVGPGHPLTQMLKDVEIAEYLHLAPLEQADTDQLVADTLHRTVAESRALAGLIQEKTGGNPFFIGEFLKALHADELIRFEHQSGAWAWDVDAIRTRDISANVVDLLVGKLGKLPQATRQLLQLAACLGNRFELTWLMAIDGRSMRALATELMPAVLQGFVLPMSNRYRLLEAEVEALEARIDVQYKFAHDRIQQAVYTSIPEADKARIHLRIGRGLDERGSDDLLHIVNQLNLARDLVVDRDERFRIARMNQRAGDKALDSAAYQAAYKFFISGLAFLAPWDEGADADVIPLASAEVYDEDYELCLGLTERAAHAAYLSADFEAMNELIMNVRAHARGWLDKVEVYQTEINALIAQHRMLDALAMAREILEPLGVTYPENPDQSDIDAAIREVDRVLDGREVMALAELPSGDPEAPYGCALRILSSIHLATYLADQNLGPIVAAKMVLLTVEHGRTIDSIHGYTSYGIELCGQGRIEQGYQFGQLARRACDQEHSQAHRANLAVNGAFLMFHWKEALRDLMPDIKQGYRTARDSGSVGSAANCLINTVNIPFLAGFELGPLERDMREIAGVVEAMRQGQYLNWLRVFWQCALNFIREYERPWVLAGEAYDEERYMPMHRSANDHVTMQLVYSMKTMLCYRFHRYRDAIAHYQDHFDGQYPEFGLLVPFTTMYYAMAQLARYPEVSPEEREAILAIVRDKAQKMRSWAELGPMNCRHKYHLVEAELARVLGRESEARDHYDQAIDLAREHKYLNEESLALERAGVHFLELGQRRLAGYYLRDAYYAYQRWGAGAKLAEFKHRYPDLLAASDPAAMRREFGSRRKSDAESGDAMARDTTRDTLATGELPDLDLETVLRASRAISSEGEATRLLEEVMRICLENAGARRGFLILVRESELIVTVAGVLGDDLEIRTLASSLDEQDGLSHGIVRYVAKTAEPVLLDDAADQGVFKNDPHIRANRCRSVLCMPILYQGTLVGIAYMENNHAPGAFQADRMEVLGLLMTQAAVSIENALLRRSAQDDTFQFTVGGSLAADTPSYVARQADRQLLHEIRAGQFCYVFNARQMGKSSLRVQCMARLQTSGVRCAAIDISAIGSEKVTHEQWYAGIARALIAGLGLGREVDLRRWWRERAELSSVQRLSELIDEVVLERIEAPIAVFIDEIDMVLGLDFGLDDFFALIRSFHNKRADDARYARLTFILLGVATPSDLIREQIRTPFNIGRAISLSGFRYDEARPFLRGLTSHERPEAILEAILAWTGGQPFLSQKLCWLAQQAASRPAPGKERDWVAQLVRERIIDRWRLRDEPEHLKSIEARIVRSSNANAMLDLYRQILENGALHASETPVESELILSGLVTREWDELRVKNPIYASVFDTRWIDECTA